MDHHLKLSIYKGMVQYILNSTSYTLKDIADLCDTPIMNIRSIYCDEIFPTSFSSELKLVKLYEAILQLKPRSHPQSALKHYYLQKTYQNGV